MNMLKFCSIFLLGVNIYAQEQVACDVHRQQFSILKDGGHTVLGAELLIGEYPTNTLCDGYLEPGNSAKYASTPEYLISKQNRNLSLGKLEVVLEDYEPGESRDAAREMFADVDGLKKEYSDTSGFFLATKAIFGPYVYITYVAPSKDGDSLTLSAYFRQKGDRYYFVNETEALKLFSQVAGSFPYWKARADLIIPPADDEGLLNATFNGNSGDTNSDYNSRLIIKYKLTRYQKGAEGSDIDKSLGVFISHMLEIYEGGDTNEINTNGIISLWQPGDDQNEIEESITNAVGNEPQETADYFRTYKSFSVVFYISYGNKYWVYIAPTNNRDQLKLIRLLRNGNDFKLTHYFSEDTEPESAAEEIMGSDEMTANILEQFQKVGQ